MSQQKQHLTPEDVWRLGLEKGMSLAEIGRKYGISRQRVSQIAKAAKGHRDSLDEAKNKKLRDAITRGLEAGHSYRKIAEECGCSKDKVRRLVDKWHLHSRHAKDSESEIRGDRH